MPYKRLSFGMDPITIGLLAGGAQGLLNFGSSLFSQKATRDANMELAQYQFSKNLEMWNLGNQYNSPQAQMERLKQAGLNPNLVYGHGATGNMATTLPQYQAPKVQYDLPAPVQIPAMIQAYQDYKLKAAQTANLEDQNEQIRQATNNARMYGEILGERKPGETYRSGLAQLNWSRMNATQDQAIQYLLTKYQTGGELLGYQRDAAKETTARIRKSIELMDEQMKSQQQGRSLSRSQEELNKQKFSNLVPRQIEAINQEIELKKTFKSLRDLDVENYMDKMYADWIFRGLGSVTDVIKTVRGMKGGKGPTIDPKAVDPNNKSWQKDKESHSQWMKRVNPGAN